MKIIQLLASFEKQVQHIVVTMLVLLLPQLLDKESLTHKLSQI